MIAPVLRLGVVTRADDPLSIRGYRECLLRELDGAAGGEVCAVPVEIGGDARLPDVDVLWDPGLGMRRVPRELLRVDAAVVATVHGLRAFSLPLAEVAGGWLERRRTALTLARARRGWRRLRGRVAAVVCVSEFGREEAIAALGLPRDRVHAIHHGVDHAVFTPSGDAETRARPFFLMVTQYQPKKNVERALAASAQLAPDGPHELVVVAPGFPQRPVPAGVTVVRASLGPAELARLYRGAIGYLCPSLHETFGMPLLEAMACGCPVVTSDVTACPEVVGDAALLVDPREVGAIAGAMRRLLRDGGLRGELRRRGVERAGTFTWQRSSQRHLEVFRAAAGVTP